MKSLIILFTAVSFWLLATTYSHAQESGQETKTSVEQIINLQGFQNLVGFFS